MKAAIHPDYHKIKIVQTDGTEYETFTTWGKEGDTMRLEIDPKTHPAWTGGERKIMEKGQLSKFEKRFGSFGVPGTAKNPVAEKAKREESK